DSILEQQRAGCDEPIVLVVHLACPGVQYTDRGKSAVVLADQVSDAIINLIQSATKKWCKQRKSEERDATKTARRHHALVRSHRVTAKEVAWKVIPSAYLKVSGGTLPAQARQVMYAARGEIQAQTGEMLDDDYFTQRLLPDYVREHPDETRDWDIVFD